MERTQESAILHDLEKKMVFLCGPRQVGKTWLAQSIAAQFPHSLYLNYDRSEDREILKREGWPEKTDLLVLDEIQKMPDWKNRIKGIFDTRPKHLRILVTGSARLDVIRQAGDSLAGRFFNHRLMPFSLAEIAKISGKPSRDMDRLIARGGFPEPFLADDPVDADRWRMQYVDGLIRTDILEIERILDFKAIRMVLELLRRRVGSPISYVSIAEDVAAAPNTVKKYIEVLEALFIIFRVTPFSHNIARSLLKEPKIYFFDNGMVEGDDGAKLENFMAVSLLKHTWALNDYKGKPTMLHYLGTRDGEEVDFCIATNDNPDVMIEVKTQYREMPKSLIRFKEKFGIPGVLAVKELKREQSVKGIDIANVQRYCEGLAL
jgi:predicted AAA+ superfamily ATPase